MPTSPKPIRDAIRELEAASVSIERLEAKFVDAIVGVMPKVQETKDSAALLSSGLYRLLKRHHDDSLLIAGSSAALASASGDEIPSFIRKLKRFIKYMDGPVATHSIKTLSTANFVHLHPEVLALKNIDTIQVLAKLPEGSVTSGERKGEIRVGEVAIKVEGADPKEITGAIRKVREAGAEIRRKEKDELRAEQAALRAEEGDEPHESPALEAVLSDVLAQDLSGDASSLLEDESDDEQYLRPQLSDAASALSRVLGSLSKTNANPQLSQVLVEARKLLMLAMKDEGFTQRTPVLEMAEEGDFH